MYNSVLLYLIAFTIVSLAPAEGEAGLAGWLALGAILSASYGLVRLRLFSILSAVRANPALAEYYRPRFPGLIQRLQSALLVPFALIIFATPYPALFALPPLSGSELLGSMAGLLPYLALVLLVWRETYPLKAELFGDGSTRRSYIASSARMEFSILGPWIIVSLIGDIVRYAFPSLHEAIESNSLAAFVYAPVFLVVTAIYLPIAINAMWGTKPLPEGPVRDRLWAMTASIGLRVREIMLWPIMEGKILTAGIIGLVPRFRYLLITPALLSALGEEEVAGVIAHEAGHVKHRHLWFYLAFFAGFFVSLISVLYECVDLAYIWLNTAHPELFAGESSSSFVSVAVAGLTIVFVFVGFRIVFGAMSRAFERQADLYSLEVMGDHRPLGRALAVIARHSGDLRDLPSWHHGSITERLDFLARAWEDPAVGAAHHEKVRRIKRWIWTGLVVFAGIAMAARLPAVREPLHYSAARSGLISYMEKHPEAVGPRVSLGMLAFDRGREAEAKDNLQNAIRLAPDNPLARNAYAWVLVKAADPSIRDCKAALAHARIAVQSLPSPAVLDTLAEVHYCLGEFDEAVKAIDLALDFAETSGDPGEREYLASQRLKFLSGKP